jgi:predicted permease
MPMRQRLALARFVCVCVVVVWFVSLLLFRFFNGKKKKKTNELFMLSEGIS